MSIHSPVYHKENREVRVTAASNGMWRVQRLSSDKPDRENDPWTDITRYTDKDTAIKLMYERFPLSTQQ